jgi:hypothetical protein
MALQMSFTTPDNRTSPASYSKVIVSRSNTPVDGSLMHEVIVQTFNSQADRAAPAKAPINLAQYYVTGTEYDTFFALSVLDQAGCNPVKQAYAFLKAHVPVGNEPDFRGATDV